MITHRIQYSSTALHLYEPFLYGSKYCWKKYGDFLMYTTIYNKKYNMFGHEHCFWNARIYV